MKKILFIFVLMQMSLLGFSEKTKEDLLLIKEWSDGNFYDETSCPTAWFFDEQNMLYKIEPDSPIIKVYKSNFELSNTFESNFIFLGTDVFWSGFDSFFIYRSGNFSIIKQRESNYSSIVHESKVADGHGLFGNLLIIEDINGKLIGYIIPKSSNDDIRQIMDNELVNYIKSNTANLDGLALDDEGIPIFRGVPFTRTGFKKYWNEKLGYFNAIDHDLNTSFRNQIRDKTGKVLETFGSDSEYFGRLTLDYEGNAFFFDGNKTFYVGRDWGYSNVRNGVVNDNSVRVRLHPGTQEIILNKIDKGEKVEILYETLIKYTVGNLKAPWLKIKTENGLVGWVYGTFIDIN